MNGRLCWLVQPEVLERYNMAGTTAVNTWEFSNESKKRSRKTDDSAGKTEEEGTPPAKAARMSLMKKFAQPASPIAASSPAAENQTPTPSKKPQEEDANVAEPSTPRTKKRVALISVVDSSSKKPKPEPSKTMPMTAFLKRMSIPKAPPKPRPSPSVDPDAKMDCIELDD